MRPAQRSAARGAARVHDFLQLRAGGEARHATEGAYEDDGGEGSHEGGSRQQHGVHRLQHVVRLEPADVGGVKIFPSLTLIMTYYLALKSAQSLNQLLLKHFQEDQIYRIDHYAGKETVQNLMVVRFANSLFEPLWNNRFIDHVEISVLEKDGIGNRVNFYEQTGAIKDFLQNHILQMLALICITI